MSSSPNVRRPYSLPALLCRRRASSKSLVGEEGTLPPDRPSPIDRHKPLKRTHSSLLLSEKLRHLLEAPFSRSPSPEPSGTVAYIVDIPLTSSSPAPTRSSSLMTRTPPEENHPEHPGELDECGCEVSSALKDEQELINRLTATGLVNAPPLKSRSKWVEPSRRRVPMPNPTTSPRTMSK
ncbi:hypothetical protein K474DRAFT_1505471 [Panus rudis PR-1116 ss-1]|nr:hypothetical protein K474DRAFT_1505471 [Panus rudis PR-1116 ss-1]